MSDDRDPIIESCLEELLSGQGPPDLKQRNPDAGKYTRTRRSGHLIFVTRSRLEMVVRNEPAES